MRVPARWLALPLLAAPFGAWALDLGDIRIQSALNQPFEAEILLEAAAPEELQGLSVALASQETFERYGLDRPSFLSSLQFSVDRNADGADVVRIRSTQPIAEPFVTMLVEAVWPRGRTMREYTVLLDPPLLLPEPVAAVPIEPAETRASQATIAESAPTPPPAVPQATVAEDAPTPPPAAPQATIAEDAPTPPPAVPQATLAESVPTPPPVVPPIAEDAPEPPAFRSPSGAAEAGSASNPGRTYGPVQRGDTLWAIASQYRPDDVSQFQMLLALYEANPQAFAGNMNQLYAGAILRIPATAEIGSIAVEGARAEFVRQNDAWQQLTRQQARLRLVPPTPESQPGGAGGATGDDADVGELRAEVAALRTELDESRRLLEIRDQELRDLQEQIRSGSDGAAQADSDPVFADEGEPAAGDGAEPAAPQPAADTAQVSTMRAILASPVTWIVGGGALILLTAFLFLRRGLRRATVFEVDLEELQSELEDSDAGDADADDGSPSDPQSLDDIGTRLDLARAYIDMGNTDGARKVLAEVLDEGDSDQREEAQTLLDALDE